jgi:predicted enzyme involved in methoxymalonyl-ACP biosynthesis
MEAAKEFVMAHPELSLGVCAEAGIAIRAGRGAAIVNVEGEELTISCWAAEVGSEWILMDRVVAEASARKCTRVRGEFVDTGRNSAMREYLAQFGFTMIGEDDLGTLWILPVSAYEPMGGVTESARDDY